MNGVWTWIVLILVVVCCFSPVIQRWWQMLKGLLILSAVGLAVLLVSAVFTGALAQMKGFGETGVRSPAPRLNTVGPCGFHGDAQAAENRALGKRMAKRYGWTDSQWNALDCLVISESGWSNTAQNPKSTAYGIGQFLDKTWAGYGYRKTSDPRKQIAAMLKYIRARYGTPEQAWEFKKRRNWY